MVNWRDYVKQGDDRPPAGNLKVLDQLYSPQLDNTRDLLVYLPSSYATGSQQYPVIYMHDGQNLFDQETSFAGDWRVDETMEEAGREGIEALVVGIPNMGEARCDEYSPFRDPKLGGGKGDAYLTFIRDTVKPLIDRDFRTLAGRNFTGLLGSSMGGLISLYGFFRYPETFGFAGAMSPALWFAQRAIFDVVEHAQLTPGKIYLDVGTHEGEAELRDVRRLRDLLRRKGYRHGRDLLYMVDEGAAHTEAAWARRLRDALDFLLPDAGQFDPSMPATVATA